MNETHGVAVLTLAGAGLTAALAATQATGLPPLPLTWIVLFFCFAIITALSGLAVERFWPKREARNFKKHGRPLASQHRVNKASGLPGLKRRTWQR